MKRINFRRMFGDLRDFSIASLFMTIFAVSPLFVIIDYILYLVSGKGWGIPPMIVGIFDIPVWVGFVWVLTCTVMWILILYGED